MESSCIDSTVQSRVSDMKHQHGTASSTLSSASTVVDAEHGVVASMSDLLLDADEPQIMSLEALEAELVRVLQDFGDSERIRNAKRVLERYSGADWLGFRRVPDPTSTAVNNYERAPVAKREGLFDLLLLSWGPNSASPIHSHPCERCYLMAISGSMFENRYRQEAGGPLTLVHSIPIPTGVATWISDDVGLHSVGNRGETVSYSLHCYIPGFTTPCVIYKEDGSSVQAVFSECTKTTN